MMKKPSPVKTTLSALCWIAVFAFVIVLAVTVSSYAEQWLSGETLRMTVERIELASVEYRAYTGRYPDSIGQLVESSGIVIDESIYGISYELTDPSSPPTITVTELTGKHPQSYSKTVGLPVITNMQTVSVTSSPEHPADSNPVEGDQP